MKAVKLKKSDLNLNLEDLLHKFGLVIDGEAFPEKLFLSKEDLKTLKANIKKKFKKEYPYLSKRSLESSVAMYWLNLGPSEELNEVLKKGYAMIGNF